MSTAEHVWLAQESRLPALLFLTGTELIPCKETLLCPMTSSQRQGLEKVQSWKTYNLYLFSTTFFTFWTQKWHIQPAKAFLQPALFCLNSCSVTLLKTPISSELSFLNTLCLFHITYTHTHTNLISAFKMLAGWFASNSLWKENGKEICIANSTNRTGKS